MVGVHVAYGGSTCLPHPPLSAEPCCGTGQPDAALRRLCSCAQFFTFGDKKPEDKHPRGMIHSPSMDHITLMQRADAHAVDVGAGRAALLPR
jgi:hypothetical protein